MWILSVCHEVFRTSQNIWLETASVMTNVNDVKTVRAGFPDRMKNEVCVHAPVFHNWWIISARHKQPVSWKADGLDSTEIDLQHTERTPPDNPTTQTLLKESETRDELRHINPSLLKNKREDLLWWSERGKTGWSVRQTGISLMGFRLSIPGLGKALVPAKKAFILLVQLTVNKLSSSPASVLVSRLGLIITVKVFNRFNSSGRQRPDCFHNSHVLLSLWLFFLFDNSTIAVLLLHFYFVYIRWPSATVAVWSS